MRRGSGRPASAPPHLREGVAAVSTPETSEGGPRVGRRGGRGLRWGQRVGAREPTRGTVGPRQHVTRTRWVPLSLSLRVLSGRSSPAEGREGAGGLEARPSLGTCAGSRSVIPSCDRITNIRNLCEDQLSIRQSLSLLKLQDLGLMEAEAPRHGASTPVSAMAEFIVHPAALVRSDQMPALGPKAQEGPDTALQWAEGCRLLETQQRAPFQEERDKVHESMSSFPREASADMNCHEDLVAEACDSVECTASIQARTPDSPGLWACPDQWKPRDITISSELGSKVESRPELTSWTSRTGQARGEEETSPAASAQTRLGPSCEEHTTETNQPRDSESGCAGPGEGAQESQEQEELVDPWEPRELQEQRPKEAEPQGEGAVGAGAGLDGLLGEQEQMREQLSGRRGEQGQRQRQAGQGEVMLAKQGEREKLMGELGGLDQGSIRRRIQEQEEAELEEQRMGYWRGPEEIRMRAQQEEIQSLMGKPEKVTGEQEEGGQGGKERAMERQGQEEVSWSEEEEAGSGLGDALQVVGREQSTGEEGKQDGPFALAPGASVVSSPCDTSCPMTRSPKTQTRAEEQSLGALLSELEPVRWSWPMSSASYFPAGGSPGQETAWDSQPEGTDLRRGTEVALAGTSVTPPWTPDSAPSSPAEVSPSTSASPPVAIPGRKFFLDAVCSPETAGASLKPPATLHGFPTAETTLDPHASPPWDSCLGPAQHLRSNSFPGSYRTELTSDLAGTSLSASHSELPQGLPPRRDCSFSLEPRSSLSTLGQDSPDFTSSPDRPRSLSSSHCWDSPHSEAFAPSSPACASSPHLVSIDSRLCEPLPPPPLEKRQAHPSTVERDGHACTAAPKLKRQHQPPPLALDVELNGPVSGPLWLPHVPNPLVARLFRPLPSTPNAPHRPRTSSSSKMSYKPLPPTPDSPQSQCPLSSSRLRTYKPLPPVPIMDPSSEPPPLPPKTRGRSQSIQGGLSSSGGQTKSRPVCQEWTVSAPTTAGRTSWPPASGRPKDALASTSRSKSEVPAGLAFSNMTNLLSPSSPTTPRCGELQGQVQEPGSSEELKLSARGSLRKTDSQEGTNGLRKSGQDKVRPAEKLSHPHLEKASSWPHRREPGKGQVTAPSEGSSKHKGWNRQGLRRPSILPEGASGRQEKGLVISPWRPFIPTPGCLQSPSSSLSNIHVLSPTSCFSHTGGPATEKSPGSSDTVIFREKKPKEVKANFSRCSRLINSSYHHCSLLLLHPLAQLLYQEYSDVFLNKAIQSQKRLDSIAETPGSASPRHPRKAVVSSESYLQRLSMVSSISLWQEIPMVRNSGMLLSMTHGDQKLQEAKFELIVSEASYLRSLQIAVEHFQQSAPLRATMLAQEHQWLFSRLPDVCDVSNAFLSDLEENFEINVFTFQVCDVVLNHAPNFRRVYQPYVTNQTYQERTFQKLMTNNSSFREVLEKLESHPVCQRLSLKSFLILPFQRITRLKLLLQNILKRSQPGSSEEAVATKAHHALEELIRDCNDSVHKMRRTEELIYLSQKIEFECKIFPLISQSRWLVKSGELTALEFSSSPGLRRKLNTRPIHLHLFNDCLLLSRPRENNRFLVFDHAPFSSIRGEKCEMKLHGSHKNLFRLFLLHNTHGSQSEFLFSTETQSEKLRWISALAMPREELDLLECYDCSQVQCLRAYKPRENDELALEKADVVMVIQQSSDGWLEGVRLSDWERGWFPVQQVEFISNPEVCARNLKEAQRVKTAKLQLVEQQT
ncbi:Rho guanine nucleotide exchange factor 5 [Galemys pyrenaicus]|uniref:Rho guanine nucleotide exchange factor 5 n=1 Tax=Galemys pyrenaicus TaxID=202257 RepID=A0A8J5ZXK6_GALPY|nr:Rho guanine nucleotide exchange factor 5 [Galemys pyrenaicus]